MERDRYFTAAEGVAYGSVDLAIERRDLVNAGRGLGTG